MNAVDRGDRRVPRDRLVEADPWRILEQRVEAPAGPDLDGRECPAKRLEPGTDGLPPGRRTGRPDISSEMTEDERRRPLDQRVGRVAALGGGRDPDVDG